MARRAASRPIRRPTIRATISHWRCDAGCNAYAAPLGFLEAGAAEFAGEIPLILKLNNHDLLHDAPDPEPAVTGSVRDALRLGCAAIGYTIYPGSSVRVSMYEQMREIAEEAKAYGLAVVVWSYPRGSGISKEGETAIDVVAYAAQIAAQLGAHFIKVKPPTAHLEQPEAKKAYETNRVPLEPLSARVSHVVQSAFDGRRIVIFSGGRKSATKSCSTKCARSTPAAASARSSGATRFSARAPKRSSCSARSWIFTRARPRADRSRPRHTGRRHRRPAKVSTMQRDGNNQATLGILVGGGPAPGINGVIASAAIEAINCGLRVIGLRDGYRWLVEGDTSHVVELKLDEVSQIHFTGGSILRTSRTNPARDEASLERAIGALDDARRPLPGLHRRRRHDLRRLQDRRAHARTNRRGDRAENDRQRPAAARERADFRFRDRARRRHHHRRIADGGRAHHRALVPGDLDGPQIGLARARHVQVGRRDAGGDPGGVPGRRASSFRWSSTPSWAR